MSGLSSLNLGVQALSAAQRALDVTGQNITNVNTDNYSRQRVQQTARGASVVPAMWSRSDASTGGVDVSGTQRIRDGFLETRAQQEHATYGSLNALSGTYADLEATFGEPSKTGLQAQLTTFWNSFQDVANDPGNAGPRSLLLEQAKTVANTINGFANQLTQQQSAMQGQIKSTVADVNSMTAQVAKLNSAIRSATLAGDSPNELADQRDALVVRIAEATGATGTPGEDGMVNVTLAGRSLVSGTGSSALQANDPDSAGKVSISFAGTGQPATLTSGSLGGMLESANVVIPDAMTKLDAVAKTLADTVNTQQQAGYNLDGLKGVEVFSGTTAATLKVAMTDPKGIAASTAAPPALDGGNAIAMSKIANQPGGADAEFRDAMVKLGIQSQSTQNATDTQSSVMGRVDDARQSVSGVSLDEEMTNLVAYQHAYASAAKYVSVIDSTLDTLIHMVG